MLLACPKTSLSKRRRSPSFNGHPPLGVNATFGIAANPPPGVNARFQWAPTLGGECYTDPIPIGTRLSWRQSFNGHPPLGVNATAPDELAALEALLFAVFQWAPTLGGECY
jgi:hypothetical protein